MRWFDIPNYPGYQITKGGLIRSWRHKTGRLKIPRILKPSLACKGYPTVSLRKTPESPRKSVLVHRLMLETFVSEKPTNMICRHINGDRTDNRLRNLLWGTYRENSIDRIDHGDWPVGQQHPRAQLTNHDVRIIRRLLKTSLPQHEIAKVFDVSLSAISHIATGRTWRWVK